MKDDIESGTDTETLKVERLYDDVTASHGCITLGHKVRTCPSDAGPGMLQS